MKPHIVSAVGLSVIIFSVHLITLPGPPLRVHLAALVSLLIGFTAPALLVESWRRHLEMLRWTALLQIVACIVLELLFSVLISKWELEFLRCLFLTILGFIGLEVLLLMHVALVGIYGRFREVSSGRSV